MSDISIIVAIAGGNAIGKGGDQPFYISEDLKHFKSVTMGKTLVMGRRTYEALPRGPLPGRHNVVVTRDADFGRSTLERLEAEGFFDDPRRAGTRLTFVGSAQEALAAAGDAAEVVVIGGGMVYGMFMGVADKLYVTEIDAEVPGADAFFPEIDPSAWRLTEASDWKRDEKSGVDYRFVCYSREI